MPRKSKIKDVEKLEADYRAGVESVNQVAKNHGITWTYLDRVAKREGWVRDLTAKVKARVAAKVGAAVPTIKKVGTPVTSAERYTPEQEEAAIEEAADRLAGVALKQRRDVGYLIDTLIRASEKVEGELEGEGALGKETVDKLTALSRSYSQLFPNQRVANGLDAGESEKSNVGITIYMPDNAR